MIKIEHDINRYYLIGEGDFRNFEITEIWFMDFQNEECKNRWRELLIRHGDLFVTLAFAEQRLFHGV